eukprot:CAMPEP_0203670708 /NCGR_PEP_ID=MMETSP0090-20130426/6714_1 /ASSEMBLY_ACC=CAM_ASM_001088 /TAXON_ID=426623 /ORGANISM="Chaetoceros affinis, Strain CCMP159" /LENGTH=812 /DNA_ID=CAMNT_0050535633 /DNA_START=56 /DNA_END=2491 /DNA_ORIENTATION=+
MTAGTKTTDPPAKAAGSTATAFTTATASATATTTATGGTARRKRSSSKARLSPTTSTLIPTSAPSEAKKIHRTSATASESHSDGKKKKRPLPVFSLYGKMCNAGSGTDTNTGNEGDNAATSSSITTTGTESGGVMCSGCNGAKNQKLPKNHPILLCDGQGCKREYHLHCTPQILNEVPSGPFYCKDCDPLGNSATLINYFDAVDELRGLFHTSRELVNFLLCLHAKGTIAKELLPDDPDDDDGDGDEYDDENEEEEKVDNGDNGGEEERALKNANDRNNHNTTTTAAENTSNDEGIVDDHHSSSSSSSSDNQITKLIELVAPDAAYADEVKVNANVKLGGSTKNKHKDRDRDLEELNMLQSPLVPQSELLRTYELHYAALQEPPSLSSYFPSSLSSGDTNLNSKKVEVGANADASAGANTNAGVTANTDATQEKEKSKEVKKSEPHQQHQKQPAKKDKYSFENKRFGPELLVGKVIRLYCPSDNQYHHGRIIDWRSMRSIKTNHPPHYKYLNKKRGKKTEKNLSDDKLYANNDVIGKSEFLARFPAGLDGRKATIQRWIVLEEHSIAVSMSMIMAQRDKGRGLNGWKPAQTVVRTRIELLPIKQYLRQDGRFALAIFFGKDNHFYLNLDTEAADLFSPQFEQRRLDRLKESSNNISSLSNNYNNTTTTKTAYVQSVEAQMDLAMSLVRIELEEQKRTFRWHKLMLDDFAHPKCLSLKSEFGLPPLEMVEENCVNSGNSNGEDQEEKEILDVREIQPNLCQLIQFGLDRQGIASKITAVTGKEFTLDTIASMRCSVGSKSRAEKMALLKKRRL